MVTGVPSVGPRRCGAGWLSAVAPRPTTRIPGRAYGQQESRRHTMDDDGAQSHQHAVDPERVARARARVPSRDDVAALASTLTLISDPTRARVLYALDVAEELCVGDLALALEVNEDAVGYALR